MQLTRGTTLTSCGWRMMFVVVICCMTQAIQQFIVYRLVYHLRITSHRQKKQERQQSMQSKQLQRFASGQQLNWSAARPELCGGTTQLHWYVLESHRGMQTSICNAELRSCQMNGIDDGMRSYYIAYCIIIIQQCFWWSKWQQELNSCCHRLCCPQATTAALIALTVVPIITTTNRKEEREKEVAAGDLQ